MIGWKFHPGWREFLLFFVARDKRLLVNMTTRRSRANASRAASATTASNVAGPDEAQESEEGSSSEAEVILSSESEDESEGEDALHGPCGGKVCGADPPPKPLRTYLGQYVAKLFEVDNQEDYQMFWGEVTCYEPSTKKFSVRYLFCNCCFFLFYFI